ncbi:nitroreductase family protein [Anaerosphaera multitolerans]|uniref:Nitroreductase family protein n=1 Tax=Anaerosphaera multitolerans TaxID=2487351 RepID=A0A437S4Z0_9FIRM|nr:nitroreductase family protein [Anaerosphaera multitolerans]RVU54026.1 nitroreductase family protein [Anaerosphaera multitolerans]
MNLLNIIKGRRSIRKYSDKKISEEDLREIVEAGIWAPSGQNRQPWYYVVIHSESEMKRVRNYFQGILPSLEEELKKSLPRHEEIIRETLDFTKDLGNADAVILAFLQKDYEDIVGAMYDSVAAGIQNMLLMAYSKEIGSCWQTSPRFIEDELRRYYAPGKGKLVGCVTLGYALEEGRATVRKDGRVKFL